MIGKYVADMLEGKLDADTQQKWRWRPGQVEDMTNDPHTLPLVELNEQPEFQKVSAKL